MASTAIVWLRRDLRLHDHPPLVAALAAHDRVVPLFVLDPAILHGRFASGPRTAFLLACLRELDDALRSRGARLVLRAGRPERVVLAVAREAGAAAVFWAEDATPYPVVRDRRVCAALSRAGVAAVPGPGLFVGDVAAPRTRAGHPFTVFTPFHHAWERLERRPVHRSPREIPFPRGVEVEEIPAVRQAVVAGDDADAPGGGPVRGGAGGRSPAGRVPVGGRAGDRDLARDEALARLADTLPIPAAAPGESAARAALTRWLAGGLDRYAERHDRLAGGTAVLSPYLHFGCLSPREVEQRARRRGGEGAEAFVRQLAWRDFCAHVLLHHPADARREHQPRMRALAWEQDDALLAAWQEGRTGYPLVDAGMRQLRASGWMHNRARLVAGSFLTKDLGLDWRAGEAWFMRWLLDGDVASNNGNWQWIASVGVDPAPPSRRILNPALQQRRHDPDGAYVRRWVPELRGVPDELLAEPWRMSNEQQVDAGCRIGADYPAPVVDHREERRRALERYRAAADADAAPDRMGAATSA